MKKMLKICWTLLGFVGDHVDSRVLQRKVKPLKEMNDNWLFDKRESSEVKEDESVHKTAEEWEEVKWGYFEEFCLEAK